jgi:hypothetical protein
MNALNLQIKAIYEQGASIEQIMSAFPELDKEAVETMLMSSSRKFQKEALKDEFYTRTMAERARDISLEMLEDPDTPAPTKARLIRFVMDEHKGRNDIKDTGKVLGGVNISVINIHLQRAQERLREAKAAKIIELPSQDRELLAKVE